MYKVQSCPLVPEKICTNSVNGKCSFGIVDVTMCPLLMWGFIIEGKFSDKEKEGGGK